MRASGIERWCAGDTTVHLTIQPQIGSPLAFYLKIMSLEKSFGYEYSDSFFVTHTHILLVIFIGNPLVLPGERTNKNSMR
jgi:hypothetical protein